MFPFPRAIVEGADLAAQMAKGRDTLLAGENLVCCRWSSPSRMTY